MKGVGEIQLGVKILILFFFFCFIDFGVLAAPIFGSETAEK